MNTNEHKLLLREEVFQVLNYLQLAQFRVGLILKFKNRILNGSDWFFDFIRVHWCSFVVLFLSVIGG
jgi:hypothetical protein